jgi:hypothetical protein
MQNYRMIFLSMHSAKSGRGKLVQLQRSLNSLPAADALFQFRKHVYPRIQCVFMFCKEAAKPEVADTRIHGEPIPFHFSTVDQRLSSPS